MKQQSKSSNTDHTRRNHDKVDRPNLDPIRDDPEPLIEPVKESPQKKPAQIGEDSYAGAQKYAEGIANYLEHADVEADAKAAAPANKDEAVSMEKAEREASSHSRENSKPKLHSEKKRDMKR
jgi:hypothetical protein